MPAKPSLSRSVRRSRSRRRGRGGGRTSRLVCCPHSSSSSSSCSLAAASAKSINAFIVFPNTISPVHLLLFLLFAAHFLPLNRLVYIVCVGAKKNVAVAPTFAIVVDVVVVVCVDVVCWRRVSVLSVPLPNLTPLPFPSHHSSVRSSCANFCPF